MVLGLASYFDWLAFREFVYIRAVGSGMSGGAEVIAALYSPSFGQHRGDTNDD